MFLRFIKSPNNTSESALRFKDYTLDYSLDKKERFLETADHYFFLQTNYSSTYIEKMFNEFNLNKERLIDAFKKDGCLVIIDKKSNNIELVRDISGLCTLYTHHTQNEIIISNKVHEIAKTIHTTLNKNSVFQLLYFDYLWDGETLYEDINQLEVGGKIIYDKSFSEIYHKINQPQIMVDENNLSDEENIIKLREEIVKAHKGYVNDKNIVYLSGGIDSVAMLIALDDILDKNQIKNHSFKVKGTTQDETEYAKSIANHLDIELDIIERDISSEINENTFKENVLKMNNPYTGIWTFSNQINDEKSQTYFAGQDTRLHTPALNVLDKLAFKMFLLGKYLMPLFIIFDLLLYPFKVIANYILSKKPITNKIFLGLRRALYLFNTKAYLSLVYFKVDKAQQASYNLPLELYNNISKRYKLSLKGIKTKRNLYNYVVSKKWVEQYVNDIRYMIDMVNFQDGKLAMPFYDMDLALFSASIPFELATKEMKGKSQFSDEDTKVTKYVLREALRDKIDKKTYLRSKAVSQTEHLTFNQGLADVLKEIFKKDLSSKQSLIESFKLNDFLERFMLNNNTFGFADEKYLLKVYYLGTIVIYNNNLKND